MAWYKPLSTPLYKLPRIDAALYPSFSFLPEPSDLDLPAERLSWVQPLSAPLFNIPPLPTGSQQSFDIDFELLTEPEAVTVDRWLQPLSYIITSKKQITDYYRFLRRRCRI